MSPQTRRHLPFIGLFVSFVHSGLLKIFVGPDGAGHQTYKNIMGESLDAQGWESVLEEAGRSGLLRPRGSGIYELHPTISPHLRKQLISTVGEEGLKKLDTEFMQFYASLAAQLDEGVRNGEENAVAFVSMEEANLLRALHLAMTNENWGQAQVIIQILVEFYECRGRNAERNALRDRSLGLVGRDISADADRNRASLWMYLLGEEANQALQRNDLANAETVYKSIVNYLLSLNDPTFEPQTASVYHQLGRIAQERQKFELAEQWYKKALEIRERLGHPPLKVNTLAQLGIFYYQQKKFYEAVYWFGQAFVVAAEYEMQVGGKIIVWLAHTMKAMGEKEFAAAWRQAFEGEEPPLDVIREVAEKLKENDS